MSHIVLNTKRKLKPETHVRYHLFKSTKNLKRDYWVFSSSFLSLEEIGNFFEGQIKNDSSYIKLYKFSIVKRTINVDLENLSEHDLFLLKIKYGI